MDLSLAKLLIALLPGIISYIVCDKIAPNTFKFKDRPYGTTVTFLSCSMVILSIYYSGAWLYNYLNGIPNEDVSTTIAIDCLKISSIPWLVLIATLVGFSYGYLKKFNLDDIIWQKLGRHNVSFKSVWESFIDSANERAGWIRIRYADVIYYGIGSIPGDVDEENRILITDVCVYEKVNEWYESYHLDSVCINLNNAAILAIEFISEESLHA